MVPIGRTNVWKSLDYPLMSVRFRDVISFFNTMQILGLSDSTPRTESRIKSLFWPSIRSEVDIDYITKQGFWLCVVVAAMTAAFTLLSGNGVEGMLESLIF